MPRRSQKSRRHKRLEAKQSDEDDDDDKQVVEPWKEAGFDDFKAYNDSMIGKITEVTSELKTLKQTTEKQEETINTLKSNAKPTDDKPDDGKPPAGDKPADDKPNEEEQYKKKAAKLYAAMSEEDRKKAEEAISKMPKELKDIAGGSFEGKYALLKSMVPEADQPTEETSFFGDLMDVPQKKSVSEQLAEALKNLNNKTNMSPEQKGSGFVPKQDADGDSNSQERAKRPKLSSLFS